MDALHVLQILDAGLRTRPELLGEELRTEVGTLLTIAVSSGLVHHLWLAVDVSGAASLQVATQLVQRGLRGTPWVRQAALTKAGKLAVQSSEVTQSVIAEAARRVVSGESLGNTRLLRAELRQFPDPRPLIAALGLLLLAPVLQLAAAVTLAWLRPLTRTGLVMVGLNLFAFCGLVMVLGIGSVERTIERRAGGARWSSGLDFLLLYIAEYAYLFTLWASALELVGAFSLPRVAYVVLSIYALSSLYGGVGRIPLNRGASFFRLPLDGIYIWLRHPGPWAASIVLGVGVMAALSFFSVSNSWYRYWWLPPTLFVVLLSLPIGRAWRSERRELRLTDELLSGRGEISIRELQSVLLRVKRPSVAPMVIHALRSGHERTFSSEAIDFLADLSEARAVELRVEEWVGTLLSRDDEAQRLFAGPFADEEFRDWLREFLKPSHRRLVDLGEAFDDEVGQLLVDSRYRSA